MCDFAGPGYFGAMEFRITVDGDPEALTRLYSVWLNADPGLKRLARLDPRHAAIKPGEMGGALETVAAVVSAAPALAPAITSALDLVRSWWPGSRSAAPLVLDVTRADGASMKLQARNVDEVEAMQKAALEFVNG